MLTSLFYSPKLLSNYLAHDEDRLRMKSICHKKEKLLQEEDSLTYMVEMPGLNKEDISLSIENGKLHIYTDKLGEIWGEKQEFSRAISIGSLDIDLNNVTADLKNGILKVFLNKKQSSYKKIEIK